MRIVTQSNGKKFLRMTKQEWLNIGLKFEEAKKKKGGKKKEWDPNPWAICNTSVGTKKTKKRERCIQHVKDQQK